MLPQVVTNSKYKIDLAIEQAKQDGSYDVAFAASKYYEAKKPHYDKDGLTVSYMGSLSHTRIPLKKFTFNMEAFSAEVDANLHRKEISVGAGVYLLESTVEWQAPLDIRVEVGFTYGIGKTFGIDEKGLFLRGSMGFGLVFGITWDTDEQEGVAK